MLTIRQSQLDALDGARLRESRRNVQVMVARSFPRDAARLGEDAMEGVVLLGMERARFYGYTTERDIYVYLTLMFMLGSGFDRDLQLPWVQGPLRKRLPLAHIHALTLEHLDEVAGENNEHLVRALVRARDLKMSAIPDHDAEDFESLAMEMLEKLHPAKFDAQDEQATLEIVRLGAEIADWHGLTHPKAHGLLAGHAFLLGSGFSRDPIYPWIREILESPGGTGGSQDSRVPALHAKCIGFVTEALR